MNKSIHHYGTFDVDNYGDLLFPKILEWRLRSADIEHISPTSGRSRFSDSAESKAAPTLPPTAAITGGGNIVRFNRTSVDIYFDCARTAYPKLLIEPAATATRSNVTYMVNAPSIAARTLSRVEKVLLSRILKAASYISFRDQQSVEIASDLTSNKVHLVPDTVFDISRMWPELKKDPQLPSSYAVFHVNSRYGGAPESVAKAIEEFSAKTGLKVVLLPIGPCHGDCEYAQRVYELIGSPSEVFDEFNLKAFAKTIAQSAIYLGSSMHGFITAASYNIPCGLVLERQYMNKFDGVLDALDMHNNVVFETWQGACEVGAMLKTPTPEALAKIFQDLDQHWINVGSCVGLGNSERKFSRVSAYSLLKVKDFSADKDRLLRKLARSVRLRQ